MKRIVASLTAAGIVMFLAWCSGADISHLGGALLVTAYCVIAAAGLTYTCPTWGRND